ANGRIAVVPSTGGAIESLTDNFDEDASLVDWKGDGIYFSASRRTWAYLYRLDPTSRRIEHLAAADPWIGTSFSLNEDAARVAFVASDASHYPEVFAAETATMTPRRLTRLGDQLDGWRLGTAEVVQWTSTDGAAIEGVLRKPAGWKAGKPS